MSDITREDGAVAVARAPSSYSIAGSGVVAIMLVTLAFHLPTLFFGALNYDEAVYTTIASAMKQGAWPYVDIYDRKPIGLFLIYGFAQSLFGDAVVGPRLLAVAATVASALGLVWLSLRHVTRDSAMALAAGFLFAAFAMLFGGDAAQAPVFYTPLVILAASLTAAELDKWTAGAAPRPVRMGLAGLALGVALQIKYSMVLECFGFGGVLVLCGLTLWREWDTAARRGYVAGLAAMIAGGLAPTVLAGAVYALRGAFDAWVFYNFTVNFAREVSDYSRRDILERIAQFSLCILPLVSLTAFYAWDRRHALRAGLSARWNAVHWLYVLLAVWVMSAACGGLALRQPYGHYFYGVLPPLAILAAAALGRPRLGLTRSGLAMLLGCLAFAGWAYAFGWSHEIRKNGSPYLVYRMADAIRAQKPASLYVFNHFGILYELTGQPLPTKYPQPGHLTRALEAKSFGFDGKVELARVLRGRPEMVVVMRPFSRTVAQDRIDLLERTLRKSYCGWSTYAAGRHTAYIYRSKTSGGCPQAVAAAQ